MEVCTDSHTNIVRCGDEWSLRITQGEEASVRQERRLITGNGRCECVIDPALPRVVCICVCMFIMRGLLVQPLIKEILCHSPFVPCVPLRRETLDTADSVGDISKHALARTHTHTNKQALVLDLEHWHGMAWHGMLVVYYAVNGTHKHRNYLWSPRGAFTPYKGLRIN